MLAPAVRTSRKPGLLDSIILHNYAYTGLAAARDGILSRESTNLARSWSWNLWQTRQSSWNWVEEGQVIGLVASWGADRRLAWLVRMHQVLKVEVVGWESAVKALRSHTGLRKAEILSDGYAARKAATDVRYVMAWRSEPVRFLDAPIPTDLRLLGNGWARADASMLEAGQIASSTSTTAEHVRLDAESRRAVELRAVEVALAWCRENGWTDVRHVGDVYVDGERRSWDIEGRDGDIPRRIEVKGTTGSLGSVQVTRKEVDAARGNVDHLMAVVHGIALGFDSNGDVFASAGKLRVYDPWLPTEDELTVRSYTWSARI
jgi:hypothetical protein